MAIDKLDRAEYVYAVAPAMRTRAEQLQKGGPT